MEDAMSAVQDFLKKVAEDRSLQEKVTAATAGATAAVAAEHGFIFTGAEYLEEIGADNGRYSQSVAGGIGSAWRRIGESELGRDAQTGWDHF
jgi:predicted ribosomally synthesized peptide with nif11-like leader